METQKSQTTKHPEISRKTSKLLNLSKATITALLITLGGANVMLGMEPQLSARSALRENEAMRIPGIRKYVETAREQYGSVLGSGFALVYPGVVLGAKINNSLP